MTSALAETLAVVAGEPLQALPSDLFIPPDPLEILLDSFSGPLDLLLYLIRHQNIDILNIPIALITKQYMDYIRLMESHRLKLACEYLLMTAILIEIKSRSLLPRLPEAEEEIENDPRLILVKKLQAYEQIKEAAMLIDNLPRCDRDVFCFTIPCEGIIKITTQVPVSLSSLTQALEDLMIHQTHLSPHQISKELLSVKERMTLILSKLKQKKALPFEAFFHTNEGRRGVVVTFLAVLELAKQALLIIKQDGLFKSLSIEAVL